MTFRALPISDVAAGTLWLGSMPGRFERWSDFMIEARLCRLSMVVALTPSEEIASLSPAYWQAIAAGSLDFRYLNLPVQNFGVPRDLRGFREGIDQIANALKAGDAVMLHCAAGIGRTGTAAACLLKRLGVSQDEALQRVRDAGSNPENALQSGLVDRF
ncbi:MAG: tyrosine-protein phosphatase [Burkholderiales bacterium]|jgi:protein-tyrosine phosphatase|nr:tyrosine-protein phosphatase [Burkholderiales bacterium]